MNVIDKEFFNKVEKALFIEPNRFSPIERTALDILRGINDTAKAQLELFETVFIQKCKQIVISTMKDLVILNEEDIYINIRYPNGWFGLFRVDEKSYFFTYNVLNNSWDIKCFEKTSDDQVKDIYGNQ